MQDIMQNNLGYHEDKLVDGTIQGQIPAYIIQCENGEIIHKGPVTSYKGLFYNLSELTYLPDNIEVSPYVEKMDCVFRKSGITKIPKGFTQLSDNMKDLWFVFADTNITEIPNDFSLGNNVSDIMGLFYNCTNISELPQNFKLPSNITNMTDTFRNCTHLTTLPSNFTIPESVENLDGTFRDCKRLTGSLLIAGNPTPRNSFQNVAEKADDDFIVYYTDKCTAENVGTMTAETGTGKVRFEKKEK